MNNNSLKILSLLSLWPLASMAHAQGVESQPVELGKVQWRRDFDLAMKEVRKSDKPAMLLFQEVPG